MNGMRFGLAALASALGLLLLTPILLLGIPLAAAILMMGRLARAIEPPVVRWPDIYQFDPLLGWKVKANLDCHVIEERHDVFHVITDRFGWAGKTTIDESDVVVLGDSHAWGYSVDHHEAFFNLNRHLRIKAVGVPGYSLVQELLLIKQLAAQLQNKFVVWLVYIGNDLADNLSPEADHYRLPFVRQVPPPDDWEIVTRHLTTEKWRVSEALKFHHYFGVLPALHSDTYFSKRAYSACNYILKAGAAICREVNAPLIVMTIPAPVTLSSELMEVLCKSRSFTKPVNHDYPDSQIKAICEQIGVRFVSLKDHLTVKHYYERDDHWTPEGHRIVARVIASEYQNFTQGR